MKKCLVLIDLQNDYFHGGNMELVRIEEAASQAGLLLETFRGEGLPVIHVRHLAVRSGATFFLPGTPGAEINGKVEPRGEERVITKNYPNSFRDTELLKTLQKTGTPHLVICGAMSHMCIDATTRAAFDLGFHCTVAQDACATRDLFFQGRTVTAADVHAAFMAALSVPYARVCTTGEIRKEMV